MWCALGVLTVVCIVRFTVVCCGVIHCGVDCGDSLWCALRGFTVVCIDGIHYGMYCTRLRPSCPSWPSNNCGVHPGDSLWCALRGFTVVCMEGIHCGVH